MKLRQLTLAWLMVLTLSAYAANEKKTVSQVTDAVQLTTDVDYIVTGTTPFATTGSVDIANTEHAVLIISSIKPSKVLTSWMNYIYINGEKAVDGENCQVKMYNRGTIIFPYAKDIQPLTCYTEQSFKGESCSNYSEGHSGGYMKTLSTNLLNNQIRSFKLKRGYMVTFAIGTGGWGYSRCFIADQEDLEVEKLPSILDQRISSYRIFKWHNAHKAGLASNGDRSANQALNTSWCYDWAQGNANNMPDTEWVPNHIYEDYPSSSTCGSVTASCHMKTNNEPGNSADDHPQDVATVLANWQNLMRTGMRLCSESSHDGSMNHLKAFIDSIDARGWRCDILDLHCYWDTGFSNLTWYSDHYGNGRPIWISEWIWGASWNRNGAFADGRTDAQILSRTKEILGDLNNNPRVERYAYWNSESKAHIYEGGSLTELGKYYATMDDGLGYNAANEYIPKATRLEALGSLTASYNRVKGTVALSWTDPNGDLMDNITVQCKLPGSATFKSVGSVTPKDKTSAEGVTYTYTDTIADPGAYIYRIKAVSFNNKTFNTDDVTVNVAPAQGTNEIQYGKLILDNLDENTINFSESFDETPCIFIGSLTNKNSKLLAGNITAKSSSKSNFTYQLYPWQTNTGELKNNEELPFLALKAGNYKYGDLQCEVGQVDANKASDNLWTDVTEVTFAQPFPEGITPVVLTEVRNPGYISAAPKTTLSTRIFDVTNTGFKFIIYSEEASGRKVALSKKVCYLAITPGIGMADVDNGILIAAGHGTDSQIYGSSQRKNNFYTQTYDEAEGTLTNEPIRLYSPTVLTALQTNNYPTAVMLRRSDITEKDDNGTSWTIGTQVKRICDHDIIVDGKTISSTATTDATADYRDQLGWVAIAAYVEGSSAPTAIPTLPADRQSTTPRIVNGRIHINGATNLRIYNTSGAELSSQSVLTPGIYVVKADGKTYRVLIR
ncbi:MAG: hypothetical protein IJR02_09110 [Bacteroidaceae bacterium]|nr:hypothetical protein [Bacteroidaceae bacterium]